jgi:hypothetical protein
LKNAEEKDGKISFKKYVQFEHLETKEFYDLFAQLDRDGSGVLEIKEINEALGNLGIKASESRVEEVLSQFDKNSDGAMSFEEFQRIRKSSKDAAEPKKPGKDTEAQKKERRKQKLILDEQIRILEQKLQEQVKKEKMAKMKQALRLDLTGLQKAQEKEEEEQKKKEQEQVEKYVSSLKAKNKKEAEEAKKKKEKEAARVKRLERKFTKAILKKIKETSTAHLRR